MDNSHTSEDQPIPDQMWAKMGADSPTLGDVSLGSDKHSRFFDSEELPWQFLGFGVLVLTIVLCWALLVFTWDGHTSKWSPEFLCIMGAIAGGLGGGLMAPRNRFPGVLGGVLSGTASPSAMYWVLVFSLWPNYGLVAAVGFLGLLPGLGLYLFIRALQQGVLFGGSKKKVKQDQGFHPELLTDDENTMAILYDQPSEENDPAVKELMNRLLVLCRQDKEVAQRLIDHEQERFPNGRLAEHVRLAIDRLQSDFN